MRNTCKIAYFQPNNGLVEASFFFKIVFKVLLKYFLKKFKYAFSKTKVKRSRKKASVNSFLTKHFSGCYKYLQGIK